jgi:hypothetical protein
LEESEVDSMEGWERTVHYIPEFTLLAQASLPQGMVAGSQEGKCGVCYLHFPIKIRYYLEKDGPMEGSSIPPTPVYSSRFLMVDEDISFATSVHWHSGHCGAGSLVDTRSTSKL